MSSADWGACARELEARLDKGAGSVLLRDEPMSAHTSFGVGGPAALFLEAASPADVACALSLAREAGLPWHVLGRGSNLLVADGVLAALVVHIGEGMSNIEVGADAADADGGTGASADAAAGRIVAQAGASNKHVAQAACEAGLAGLEFLHGIPGSIGGAAIMNAGAYDGEFKDVCTRVSCLDPASGQCVELDREEAGWGYRSSAIGSRGLVVLSAELALFSGDRTAIEDRMRELASRRRDKQPLDKKSAGSTFKRPAGHFAGKLIQDAGMQGHSVGAAQVSCKHAGFVVNNGGATAAEILACIRDVQDAVRERCGVELECEVRMLGFGANA